MMFGEVSYILILRFRQKNIAALVQSKKILEIAGCSKEKLDFIITQIVKYKGVPQIVGINFCKEEVKV